MVSQAVVVRPTPVKNLRQVDTKNLREAGTPVQFAKRQTHVSIPTGTHFAGYHWFVHCVVSRFSFATLWLTSLVLQVNGRVSGRRVHTPVGLPSEAVL
ncbi:hypothetical protein BDQ17DRAFT_1421851 [Cyathus striatus]|nr:hypothetical protein BDQ17DRAFT_1421851 [Cyathus striatus]